MDLIHFFIFFHSDFSFMCHSLPFFLLPPPSLPFFLKFLCWFVQQDCAAISNCKFFCKVLRTQDEMTVQKFCLLSIVQMDNKQNNTRTGYSNVTHQSVF